MKLKTNLENPKEIELDGDPADIAKVFLALQGKTGAEPVQAKRRSWRRRRFGKWKPKKYTVKGNPKETISVQGSKANVWWMKSGIMSGPSHIDYDLVADAISPGEKFADFVSRGLSEGKDAVAMAKEIYPLMRSRLPRKLRQGMGNRRLYLKAYNAVARYLDKGGISKEEIKETRSEAAAPDYRRYATLQALDLPSVLGCSVEDFIAAEKALNKTDEDVIAVLLEKAIKKAESDGWKISEAVLKAGIVEVVSSVPRRDELGGSSGSPGSSE